MKLALIEIDGIIANNAARFARAEEAKLAFIQDPRARTNAMMSATEVYWHTALSSELVALDTLIDGAVDGLGALYPTPMQESEQAYITLLLTSRPESLREATCSWLDLHRIPRSLMTVSACCAAPMSRLIMKPPVFQYTKTVLWKAGIVQTPAALFGADDVLFVDPIQANREELTMRDHPFSLRCAASLGAAINGEDDATDNDEGEGDEP